MYKKTDSEIQQAVLKELNWDTRVQSTEVGVEVHQGVVTLTGTVANWAKRVAAQEAAHRVAGVLDVANDVVVRFPGDTGRTDTDIATAVRHALEWDVLVPQESVTSTVSAGWVTLEGDVSYWSNREDAEKAIRNLAGVHGVTNKIAVKPPGADLNEVRRSIEAALERQADLRARRIALEIHEGRVKLTGAVQSWSERQAAVRAVKGTYGVREVEDLLRIEPYAA